MTPFIKDTLPSTDRLIDFFNCSTFPIRTGITSPLFDMITADNRVDWVARNLLDIPDELDDRDEMDGMKRLE